MQCPVCNNQLSPKTIDQIHIDVCDGGCGGIWFDRFELSKFDEPHEEAGLVLLDLDLKKTPKLFTDPEKQIKCPKCLDLILLRNFFSVKRQVKVDVCPGCAGTWLDVGELRTIRSEYQSEDERRRAAEACFDDLFRNEIAAAKSSNKSPNVRRVVNLFRFICPSYYIPNKQK